MSLVFVFVLVALIAFLVLSAAKFAKYSKFSVHSRFDLYPVPKEGGGHNEHGGSYFEEPEWWTKERKIDRKAETIDILKEMLVIRKLFINQRSMWVPSMLFHGGIYVMLGWSVLLLIAVFVPNPAYMTFVSIVGVVGFVCATLGAAILLVRRITDEGLRVYTTPEEYFNLCLILVVLITGMICWTTQANVFAVATSVVTFKPLVPAPSGLVLVHLVLLGAMMIYIPLGKMGHYAGKFFAFRSVMWNNEPNMKGNKVEQQMQASAATPAQHHWDAPHISPAPQKDSEE